MILGLAYPLVDDRASPRSRSTATPTAPWCSRDGTTVGSDLIGQAFTRPVLENGKPKKDADGNPVVEPDPQVLPEPALGRRHRLRPAVHLGVQPRPGEPGPHRRRSRSAGRPPPSSTASPPSQVPPDALLASGSGLDPHISPAYAREQVARVARERGLSESRRSAPWSTQHTQGRVLGFLGEPRVNVLELNLALDAASRG